MKLSYILIPVFLLMSLPAVKAQSVTSSTVSSSVSTVRGVGNDLKKKKYRDAAGRVMDNKEVKKRVALDDKTRNTLFKSDFRAKIKDAKSDFRKNPATFAQKYEKEYRFLRKYRPKWLKRNLKRSRLKK